MEWRVCDNPSASTQVSEEHLRTLTECINLHPGKLSKLTVATYIISILQMSDWSILAYANNF